VDVSSDDDWGQLTVISEYKDLPIQGKRVMDVGGNIGAFAIRAALEGCEVVHTYEPEDSNFCCLMGNCQPFASIRPKNYALTNDHSGTKKNLWLTTTGTMGSCSTTEFRGRVPQEIVTVNFMEQLEQFKFTSIKMDCEGEEWELLGKNTLPDFVTDVVAELHFTKRIWREEYYDKLLAHMDAQGFRFLREPKNTGKNFHTLAHWRRT
jgi:FkbM family methyltransferase